MPKPGSRNTLTPKNVVYSRATTSGVQTVNSTVHTANVDRTPNTHTTKQLPEGHRHANFVSDTGKANVQNFIKNNYGDGAERITFSSSATFHGIVGPDNKIVAAGEVKKMSWAMSELGHLTVAPQARGKGLGASMLEYLESKTKTPIALITTKNPSVEHMSENMGFAKMSTVQGPSGDNVSVYTKTLKPAE